MNCERNCKHKAPRGRVGALYIHVPFCRAKCRYCDFYSVVPAAGQAEAFVAGAARELAARRGHLRQPLDSVFVGGGTPTALAEPLLRGLLGSVADLIDGRTEFSVEANPCTITPSVVEVLCRAGVNRVNIGVQSFVDEELAAVGRLHTAEQACAAIECCRGGGVANIGLDLMYGLPGQTVRTWRRSLEAGLSLVPAHLSCYGLSYEAGTPLAGDVAAGRVARMEEEDQRECYYAAKDAAESAGMDQYEISNFARAGRRCVHNLTYWQNRPYVGVGPGAASYVNGTRRRNAADLEAWLEAVSAGLPAPGEAETLGPRAHMAETVMLLLRLREGVDREVFAERFGVDVVEAFAEPIGRYVAQGALEATPTHLRLTDGALIVADTVLADIIACAGGGDGSIGEDSDCIVFRDRGPVE